MLEQGIQRLLQFGFQYLLDVDLLLIWGTVIFVGGVIMDIGEHVEVVSIVSIRRVLCHQEVNISWRSAFSFHDRRNRL